MGGKMIASPSGPTASPTLPTSPAPSSKFRRRPRRSFAIWKTSSALLVHGLIIQSVVSATTSSSASSASNALRPSGATGRTSQQGPLSSSSSSSLIIDDGAGRRPVSNTVSNSQLLSPQEASLVDHSTLQKNMKVQEKTRHSNLRHRLEDGGYDNNNNNNNGNGNGNGNKSQTPNHIISDSNSVMNEHLRGQNNSNNSIHHNRHRKLQSSSSSSGSSSEPTCKQGTTLNPGDSLSINEYLCYGHLRLGIHSSGHFILGLSDTPYYTSSNNNSDSSNTIVTPVRIAWMAYPTNLFLENRESAKFAKVILSYNGNLLGYDEEGTVIYDSNYDYSTRMDGKESDSILGFSSTCRDLESLMSSQSGNGGNSGNGGTMCLMLTSPPTAGYPYGVTTWGVEVDMTEDMMEVQELEVEVTEEPTNVPTDKPTNRPTNSSPTSMPTREPTKQPVVAVTVVESDLDAEDAADFNDNANENENANDNNSSGEQSFIGSAIIWGTVWLDSNQNSLMEYSEERIGNFKVDLYDCSNDDSDSNNESNNSQSSTYMESSYTNGEGMYFFQVSRGGKYKAKFDVEGMSYGYSLSGEGNGIMNEEGGWTECQMPTSASPIEWNAGLIQVDSISLAGMEGEVEGDVAMDVGKTELEEVPEAAVMVDPDIVGDAAAAAEKLPSLDMGFAVEDQGATTSSSLGGTIYLDLNSNGSIDGKEVASANNGFIVEDATVQVLVIDCDTDDAVGYPVDVSIPGTYHFDDLVVGSYRVSFAVLDVAPNGQVGTGNPPYSFVDGSGRNTNSTSWDSECLRLESGEGDDSVDAGLFPAPLTVNNRVTDEIVPFAEGMEAMPSISVDTVSDDRGNLRTNAVEDPGSNQGGGGNKSVVAGAVAGVFGCCLFALGLFAMMKRRRGSSSSNLRDIFSRVSARDLKPDDDEQSIGSSVKDDLASKTDDSAIKSLDSLAAQPSVAGVQGNKLAGDNDSDSDSDSDSSSDDDSESESDEESSNQQEYSESEDESIEVSEDGNIVASDDGKNPGNNAVAKTIIRKTSSDLDQNRYQHPYHSSLSLTSDTHSDGPFESSDDESESSADIARHLAPFQSRQQSQESLSANEDNPAKTENNSPYQNLENNDPNEDQYQQQQSLGQDNTYGQYQQQQGQGQDNAYYGSDNNMSEDHYQQQQHQGQENAHYGSAYQHPNQPSYPALYSNMEDEASCSELSAAHSHASNDHNHYRNYDHTQGYGVTQDQHDHQDYHNDSQGPWDGNQYGSQGQGQYYDQSGQQYDYQYQYANSGGYDQGQYDYGDASVSSSRSADPPAASYRQLPEAHHSDDNEGGHEYGQNEENERNDWGVSPGPFSDHGDDVHEEIYDDSGYHGQAAAGYDGHVEMPRQTGNSFHSTATNETEETERWSNLSSNQRAKSTPRSWKQYDDAIPENSSMEYDTYVTSNDTNYYDRSAVDDTKSILSAGSDQSSDPPGASYKVLQFPPPPPRRLPPPPPPRR